MLSPRSAKPREWVAIGGTVADVTPGTQHDRPTMSIDDFFDALRASHGGDLPLGEGQELALRHDHKSPLWIIAGPGTGKTHTLTWLVLKRILVDGQLPERIIFTTFTKKAAAELETRLLQNRQKLADAGVPGALDLDVSRVWVGTLHSLCSRILADYRYEPTLRIRVLEDEQEQQYFLRRTQNELTKPQQSANFWSRFGIEEYGGKFAPSTAKKAEGAVRIFNRMTENSVDLDAMRNTGDRYLVRIADAYEHYRNALVERHRCDQAHLQAHLLDFLRTEAGQAWIGDGLTVVVDEYQDTNPIQEKIYFELTGKRSDITVVGDDDQSLYRFRGATVETLVNFDKACTAYSKTAPKPVYLHENRRSHPQIVDWVNRYIQHHPAMSDPKIRVRAPGKPALEAASSIAGDYPAVMVISESQKDTAVKKFTDAIDELWNNKMVSDLSQIALLTYTTRETSHGIEAYCTALRSLGYQVYNPRSRVVHKDPVFLAAIGALSTLIDNAWDDSDGTGLPKAVKAYVDDARAAYQGLIANKRHKELRAYVSTSQAAIENAAFDDSKEYNYLVRQGGRKVSLSGLFYKILSHEPFCKHLTDPVLGERLKALNLAMAQFESVYYDGQLRLERPDDGSIRIYEWTLRNFYSVFVEGIHDGVSDPEDDEVSIQRGAINVMTIHQSKGLQFEVVFVLRPDKFPKEGGTHILEDELDSFARRAAKPLARRTRAQRAEEDVVRLFFVAYSRAKRLVILTGTNTKNWGLALGHDQNGAALPTHKKGLKQLDGVHIL